MARAVAVARPGANEPRYFESGYPYDHDQFISIAGAAWAVIALSEALPSVSARPLFDSPSSNDRQGWVETALFGSVDDLRRVLDSGLDANAATTSGGTTLLMMAAAEADKMRLLIERGADVNVRSQAGYTALVIAAQFRDASAAIDLLLDRGAAVKTADERLATMHPLGLAAHAGNAHVLARLFHVGDHLESPIRVNAAGPGLHSPMALAIRDGHIDVVRALLDLGADVNVVQGDDWSPLERAVVNNNLDIARLIQTLEGAKLK